MRTLLILCFLVLAASPSMAYGDEPIEALRKGVQEGLQVLQGPKFTDQELKEAQQQKLRLILERLFDFHEFPEGCWPQTGKILRPPKERLLSRFLPNF